MLLMECSTVASRVYCVCNWEGNQSVSPAYIPLKIMDFTSYCPFVQLHTSTIGSLFVQILHPFSVCVCMMSYSGHHGSQSFHNLVRHVPQLQGASWWEACRNNRSQGLWIQELGLSRIYCWFWYPSSKCSIPFSPMLLSFCFVGPGIRNMSESFVHHSLKALKHAEIHHNMGTWHLHFNALQSHYPQRVEKLFMVNVPLIFNGLWKVVSPFIKDAVREKVTQISYFKFAPNMYQRQCML